MNDNAEVLAAIQGLAKASSDRFDKLEDGLRHVSDQSLRIENRVSSLEVRQGQVERDTQAMKHAVERASEKAREARQSASDIEVSHSEMAEALMMRAAERDEKLATDLNSIRSSVTKNESAVANLSISLAEVSKQNAKQSVTLGSVDRAQPRQLLTAGIAAAAAIATALAELARMFNHPH